MINFQWKHRMGYIKLKARSSDTISQVNIYQGNCLAVFIYEWEDQDTHQEMYRLFAFFSNARHAHNFLSTDTPDTIFGNILVSIRLNLYYKDANTLLKIFTKKGYTVECYYQEPKEDNETN